MAHPPLSWVAAGAPRSPRQWHEVPWGKGKADISPPSKAPMRIEMHGSTRARLSFLDISRDSKLSSITSLQLALPKSPGEGLALLINETQGRRGRTRPLCSWKCFKRPGLGAGGTPRRSPRGFVGWETSVSVSAWFGSRVEEGRGITKCGVGRGGGYILAQTAPRKVTEMWR